MSLVDRYHEEHKARLARIEMAARRRINPPKREVPKPPPMERRSYIYQPEYYYRTMWFWDLVSFSAKPDLISRPPIRKIAMVVSMFYGVATQDMIAERRTKQIVRARQVAMYLARQLTLRSYPEIGRYFGGRDHTTVLHATKKIEGMAQFPEMRGELEILTSRILAP